MESFEQVRKAFPRLSNMLAWMFWPRGDLNNGNTSKHPLLRSPFHSTFSVVLSWALSSGALFSAVRVGYGVVLHRVAASSPTCVPVADVSSCHQPLPCSPSGAWRSWARQGAGLNTVYVSKIAAVTHCPSFLHCPFLGTTETP